MDESGVGLDLLVSASLGFRLYLAACILSDTQHCWGSNMEYETGKWYGWNGGECPVHPETVIQTQRSDEARVEVLAQPSSYLYAAAEWDWTHSGSGGDIVAFRVITPYVEPRKPREFWVKSSDYFGVELLTICDGHETGATLFREVIE